MEMRRINKTCKTCGIELVYVIETKKYCTPCAIKRNIDRTRERQKKGIVKVAYTKKKESQNESLYKKITGKRRRYECDGSGFF